MMDYLEILQQSKTESGRAELFKQNDCSDSQESLLEQICRSVVEEDGWSHLPFIELRRVLWIIRNCCCGNEKVIETIQKYKLLIYLYQSFQSSANQNVMASALDTENSLTETHFSIEEIMELLSILLQLFCNFCSISISSTSIFFEDLGFEELLHLLALSSQLHSRKSVATLWHLMYLLICSQKLDYERRMDSLLSTRHRALLCGLFLSLQPSSSSSENQASEDIECSIHEWSQLLLFHLLQSNRLKILFEILDSRNSELFTSATEDCSHSVGIINMEQIIVMHQLLSMTEDSSLTAEFTAIPLIEQTLVDFVKSGDNKYRLLVQVEALFPSMKLTPEEALEKYEPIHISLYQDYCLVYLELVISLLNLYELTVPSNSSSKSEEIISGCILKQDQEYIQDILQKSFSRIQNWDFIHRKRREKEENRVITLQDFEKDFIKCLLQLMSLLVYHNLPFAQTLAHAEKEMLHILLCYCTTDIEIPLAREWALLSIRNLCEQSIDIQEYISSLRPQEMKMDDEILRRINKEIRLDPMTGKLIVEEKKNT